MDERVAFKKNVLWLAQYTSSQRIKQRKLNDKHLKFISEASPDSSSTTLHSKYSELRAVVSSEEREREEAHVNSKILPRLIKHSKAV